MVALYRKRKADIARILHPRCIKYKACASLATKEAAGAPTSCSSLFKDDQGFVNNGVLAREVCIDIPTFQSKADH